MIIPQTITNNISQKQFGDSTWAIEGNHLYFTDNKMKSVIQAAYLILQTPRYKHIIYSWQYGCELETLIGKDEDFILSESRRMITDALLADDRITDVTNFHYQDKVLYFTINTIYGSAELSTEVIK